MGRTDEFAASSLIVRQAADMKVSNSNKYQLQKRISQKSFVTTLWF